MQFRNLYGLACLAGVLGMYVRLSGSRWWGDVLFLAAGLLLIERSILWRLRATSAYRSTPSLREPVELKIEESNIIRTSAGESTEIRWANILACHETQNLFVLRPSPTDLLVLPKRAFSPGDLFRFKELRQKELIVKTTRENPDIVLLRFIVSWGLLAAAGVALSLGYVHNFLTGLPRNPQQTRSSPPADPPITNSPPVVASATELRGRGSVYLVPFGTIHSASVPQLLQDFYKRYGLQVHLLPAISPPTWAKNVTRKQFVAEDLVTAIKLAYPHQAAEPGAVMMGITDDDMYISELNWTYAFSFRSEERFAVISTSHLAESVDGDNKPLGAGVLQKRTAKMLRKDLGILYYRLQPSNNYGSVLYDYINDVADLDDIGEDYIESDVIVRADLHVREGDPCFVLRNYTAPEREHPELGTVADCNGYYKEPNLETVQIDLRYGLLLDQRTDFRIQDHIPLELTRVLRTQDDRSRAFGTGGNHNLNIVLIGDKWPFTWVDLVLEHGGRSHFRRSNWGFGYWDARYTNRDVNSSKFRGSTIDWGWPGWKLKSGGMTYLFADANGASRPEQAALAGIQTYNGKKLVLDRDAAGNLLHARSPAGHQLDFKYDQNNRVIEVNDKEVGRFEYSYDATGHLARVTDADQRITEYGYDSSGRMNRIMQSGKEICHLEYDPQGRVNSETTSGGRTYLFHYSVSNTGNVWQVEINDSAGPIRKIRMNPVEYMMDVRAQDQH